MIVASKIGPRLEKYISQCAPDQTKTAYVYIGLSLKTADLLKQISDQALLAHSKLSISVQQALKRVSDEQQAFISKIRQHARQPIRSVILNNTVTSEFTIAFILNTIVAIDEVKLVEMVDSIPAEEFFGTAKHHGEVEHYMQGQQDPIPEEYLDSRTVSEAEKLSKDVGVTGKGILIGLIDSGAHPHVELSGRWWNGGTDYPNHGKNFGDGDFKDTADLCDHGTGCASIIAGSSLGVAKEVTIMILRVMKWNKEQCKYVVDNQACWEAMDFAALNDCHICTMAGSFPSQNAMDLMKWREELDAIHLLGLVFVASSGKKGLVIKDNDTADPNYLPFNMPVPANQPPPWLHADQIHRKSGSLSSVVAVSAINTDCSFWERSGRGPAECDGYPYTPGEPSGLIKPEWCAPGGTLNVCSNSGPPYTHYHSMNGTSPATSHVSGCVALLLEKPISTVRTIAQKMELIQRIVEAISETCKPFADQSAKSKTDTYGTGLIQAHQAYLYGKSKAWWS